ncbi:MAG: DUF523 and DUF1722 domain-containing protein, partial [Candidatus Omnitrophica bacterium]|nr:DUF523 and DUF1722 domain-containing protein [Candidatus Omnitrophota bacterium]
MEKITLGISACLLGENVRYDGGHKHDRFLTDTLGKYVTYLPVCPEVEYGLGVPRESMRLVGDPASPRLVTIRTRQDYTEGMIRWARQRVAALEKDNLCGFIFKSDSPSSGMERVKVYKDGGMPEKKGIGIFARIFMEHFPLIPVEEEGRLHDPLIRENFIERIFTLKRWVESVKAGRSRGRLVDFHTRHKLLILSHSEKHERIMGRIVAQGVDRSSLDGVYQQYQTLLMEALRFKATPKKNANVLQHMMWYFKQRLSADEKIELQEIIDQFRMEWLPLIVPVTLI